MDFKGKRVLVTGGGGGLGSAIARKFYEANAHVIILDRDEKGLSAVKKELPNVTTVQVDLQDWEETKTALENVGVIDHLVNNVGIAQMLPFMSVQKSDLERHMNINFFSMVNVTQCVAKKWIENNTFGTVVNIASVAGKFPWPNMTAYSASKAAVIALTKTLAVELPSENARVNCICPGLMDTPIIAEHMEAVTPLAIDHQIIKRLVTTDEVADSVMFLSSTKSASITGITLDVDAGFPLK